MDIWEANARSTAFTPHACNETGVYQCTGALCGSSGVCDESGCGYNAYALGNTQYYGPNGTVDTNKVFTVVTQFITDTGDASGELVEIRRLYVQDGVVIQNAAAQPPSLAGNTITQERCNATAADFTRLGGLTEMGQAISRGMVLIFSIWNDNGQFMNWLDSGSAGPCTATEGNPALIKANEPDTYVTFSNIKWGDLNSTYTSTIDGRPAVCECERDGTRLARGVVPDAANRLGLCARMLADVEMGNGIDRWPSCFVPHTGTNGAGHG
jgi:cellulase